MASTFTSRFKLEKMETGANANTWGTRTNNNLDVVDAFGGGYIAKSVACLLYTSPSPRDGLLSRMPSSA